MTNSKTKTKFITNSNTNTNTSRTSVVNLQSLKGKKHYIFVIFL